MTNFRALLWVPVRAGAFIVHCRTVPSDGPFRSMGR